MLSQASFLARKVLPHGESGAVVGIPADVRRDADIEPGDPVDIEYNKENGTMTVHLRDD